MLALGGITIWHLDGVPDMRLGKYRLFQIAADHFRNPYNGDAFAFMSKDRRTLEIVRYDNHKIILYDISYERGYKFMTHIYRNGELRHQLDFKYLVALLDCLVRKKTLYLI